MTSDIASNDDYGPWSLGFTGLADPENPVDLQLQLTQIADAIDSHNSNAHNAVLGILEECVKECESLNGYCHDCMVGNAIRYIEQAEKIHDKINDKLMSALAGIVTDMQMAQAQVDQIASFIQQGGTADEIQEEKPFDPATAELIQNQARLAGEEYRLNEGSPLLETGIVTVDQVEPLSVNPPSGGGTHTGGGDGTTDCECPPGYVIGSGFDPVTGKYGPVCKSIFGGPDISCGPVEPPPPPPNGKCVDLESIANLDCADVCFTIGDDTLGWAEALELIRGCCVKDYLLQGGNLCTITGVPEPPEEPEPEPPTTSQEEDKCEFLSLSEYVDLELDYETGQVNEYGQELSTETDPIWIWNPANPDVFQQIKIGEPNPTIPPPSPPHLTTAELMDQALRNNGKVQACRADIGFTEFDVDDNPILSFNYCSTKGYVEIDAAIEKYHNVAKNLCDHELLGNKHTAAAVYDLLAGEDGANSKDPNVTLSLAAASLYVNTRRNCLYNEVYQKCFPSPDGCNRLKIATDILWSELLEGDALSGKYRHPSWRQSITYMRNYDCQYLLPSADIFDAMRLAGRIDKDQWEFGQKIYGYCVPWKEKVIDAQRPTPSFQVIYGWCRANIIDDDEKKNLLKRVGIESDQDIENFEFISEALPPYSDLIRLMVRDVEDQSVVDKFKLDTDFDKKFAGQVKEWALRQNVSEDIFKKLWRAHWYYPSDSQAFEMYHRLREDTDLGDLETGKLEFTKEDLKQLLKVNDVAPGMIDNLIAIAYRPMGLRQIARAYETNSITAKDAEGFYKDIGYNPKDAKILCEYLQVDSAERRAKFLGRTLPNDAAKFYQEGLVNAEAYAGLLREAGMPDEIIQARIEKSNVAAAIADMRAMIKSVRKQYLRGDLDENQYRQRLTEIGVDEARISEILRRDLEEKRGKNKEIAVGRLCQLVKQGLLNPVDYFTRAMNFGYKIEDASLLVESCMIEKMEALQKKIEAQIRQATADAIKAEAIRERQEAKKKKAEQDALPCKPRPKPLCPA